MKIDGSEPLSMGGASVIIILSTFIMGIIIVLMISTAYKTYEMNQAYVEQTEAYYAADGEATIKRALIEEQLYKLYHSKINLKYDLPHILKVVKDIKGIEVTTQDETTVLIQYTEPINEQKKLVVVLSVQELKGGLDNKYFTQVLKWQVK